MNAETERNIGRIRVSRRDLLKSAAFLAAGYFVTDKLKGFLPRVEADRRRGIEVIRSGDEVWWEGRAVKGTETLLYVSCMPDCLQDDEKTKVEWDFGDSTPIVTISKNLWAFHRFEVNDTFVQSAVTSNGQRKEYNLRLHLYNQKGIAPLHLKAPGETKSFSLPEITGGAQAGLVAVSDIPLKYGSYLDFVNSAKHEQYQRDGYYTEATLNGRVIASSAHFPAGERGRFFFGMGGDFSGDKLTFELRGPSDLSDAPVELQTTAILFLWDSLPEPLKPTLPPYKKTIVPPQVR